MKIQWIISEHVYRIDDCAAAAVEVWLCAKVQRKHLIYTFLSLGSSMKIYVPLYCLLTWISIYFSKILYQYYKHDNYYQRLKQTVGKYKMLHGKLAVW